ncbi:hypothetical protein NDU88_001629 [Pleurodeles waltl]|uniref:Uncharacterized protein n=1 Tax=Pleurodeles waltl TaxID=8319 RepID=A0AAV7UAY3_PLEWA|nr:hypothetical protein NDU88_001629 [Pleurodeles waltl]
MGLWRERWLTGSTELVFQAPRTESYLILLPLGPANREKRVRRLGEPRCGPRREERRPEPLLRRRYRPFRPAEAFGPECEKGSWRGAEVVSTDCPMVMGEAACRVRDTRDHSAGVRDRL